MANNIQIVIDFLLKNKEQVLKVLEQLKEQYGIDIDTSAMDQAFGELEANLEGLEGTEVTIEGDSSGAVDAANEAESAIDEIPEEHETEISASNNASQTLTAVFTGYMALLDVINKVKAATSELVNLSNTQEKAEKHLEIAIKQTGDASEETFNKFKNLASSVQELTTIGDEAIMPVMRLGLNMGILTGDLEEATKGAIGLSKGFNLDLTMAMKMHTLATQGDFNMLQRYIPALRQATTDAEKMAIVKKAEADGWAVATSETQTGFGVLEDYANSVGDLKEKLGDLVKAAMIPFVNSMNDIVGSIGNAIDQQLSEKLRDEQIEFTALVGILKDANTHQEVRNLAIAELQSKYSSYLGNLDLEKATIKDIAAAQKTANEEFERKIRLQAAEEVLIEAKKKYTNAIKEEFLAQKKFNEEIERSQEATDIYASVNIGNAREALEKWHKKVEDLGTEYNELYEALVNQGLITKKTEEDIDTTTEKVDELKQKLKEFANNISKIEIPIELGEIDTDNDEDIIQRETDKLQKIFDLRAEYRGLNRELEDQEYLSQFEEGEERELATVELEQQRFMEQAQRLEMNESEMSAIVEYYETLKNNIRNRATKNQIKESQKIKQALVKMNKVIALSAMESADAHKNVGEAAKAAAMKVVVSKAKEAVATQIAKVTAMFPFPINVIVASAAGAAMGVLIQSAVNQVSSGIKAEKGTVLKGRKHSQGGIRVVTPSGDVEAEGGEPILTAPVSDDDFLLAMVSLINQKAGGDPLPGAKKPSMGKGGLTGSSSSGLSFDNSTEILKTLEAINANIVKKQTISFTIETTDPEIHIKQDLETSNRMKEANVDF